MEYVTKDSGERQRFTTGAQRDAMSDKPRPGLMSPFALMREAELYARGAEKYDDRNWEKGMPFSRVVDSLFRHLLQYMSGDREEDHLAAIRWNSGALIHYEEMIGRGVLSEELNDLPKYKVATQQTLFPWPEEEFQVGPLEKG